MTFLWPAGCYLASPCKDYQWPLESISKQCTRLGCFEIIVSTIRICLLTSIKPHGKGQISDISVQIQPNICHNNLAICTINSYNYMSTSRAIAQTSPLYLTMNAVGTSLNMAFYILTGNLVKE